MERLFVGVVIIDIRRMGQRAATELTTDDGGTGDGAEERLPKDEIFDLMGNHRRRYAIHYCKQTDGGTNKATLRATPL